MTDLAGRRQRIAFQFNWNSLGLVVVLGNPIKLDYFTAYLASYIRLLRSNLRFQSLIGLTPERKVDYFSVCWLAKTSLHSTLKNVFLALKPHHSYEKILCI